MGEPNWWPGMDREPDELRPSTTTGAAIAVVIIVLISVAGAMLMARDARGDDGEALPRVMCDDEGVCRLTIEDLQRLVRAARCHQRTVGL